MADAQYHALPRIEQKITLKNLILEKIEECRGKIPENSQSLLEMAQTMVQQKCCIEVLPNDILTVILQNLPTLALVNVGRYRVTRNNINNEIQSL